MKVIMMGVRVEGKERKDRMMETTRVVHRKRATSIMVRGVNC